MKIPSLTLSLTFNKDHIDELGRFFEKHAIFLLVLILSGISVVTYVIFYQNGLGLAYNDARSHLDIGRRVVEGLSPGLAQLGSVWLPLPHALMIPVIWNDFMWHSGLAGALISMVSYVATGVIIYLFLRMLGVGILGRFVGVFIFAANLNALYLQSTAMTELLLIATMTAGVYELVKWYKTENILHLIRSAFWIMLSTLVRYDGWFLLTSATILIVFLSYKKWGYKVTEGKIILFLTLAGLGIVLWFLWNYLIFDDPLYFAFGPYSAKVQQEQLKTAGVLATQGNVLLSLKLYLYSVVYNIGAFTSALSIAGIVALSLEKSVKKSVRIAAIVLLIVPLIFNVLALYLGHSVLFIQAISGDTWFNVRYGIMMLPAVAVLTGYLVHKLKPLAIVIVGLLLLINVFSFTNTDAVTIDDARVGSSQKNVAEVSGWLRDNAKDEKGFILISAASHDAIIFSSGLKMKRFIHEGTGDYWESATSGPEHWARWIVMRTHDDNDSTFRLVKDTPGFAKYELIDSYPFADIYEIKHEYLDNVNTEPILNRS